MRDPLCIECPEPADWVRDTQFAGTSHFCDVHARLEKDFKKDDDSTVWERLIRRKTVQPPTPKPTSGPCPDNKPTCRVKHPPRLHKEAKTVGVKVRVRTGLKLGLSYSKVKAIAHQAEELIGQALADQTLVGDFEATILIKRAVK